ncbi:MAG: Modification methylase PaeR7I [candidate division WS2 bacterium]|nr:Modification methylase PaeR7I [Candidatus Psychracetigena formicireducens]
MGIERRLENWQLFKKLEELKPLHFNETNAKKKQAYKSEIDDLINQITDNNQNFDFEVYFSEVFHEKGGFDVVIANPPYVEHKKLKEVRLLLKNYYETYSGTADIYVYFYERGMKILKGTGVLTFISSNKFMKTSYGAKLRGLLTHHGILRIVDFTQVHVFDALVASCVVIVSKEKNRGQLLVTFADDEITDFPNLSDFIDRNYLRINPQSLNSNIWQLEDSRTLTLKSKIESGSKKISDIESIHIYRGITTGLNEVFIIDEEQKNELVNRDKKSLEILKPILRGRDVNKWYYKFKEFYMIYTYTGIDIKKYEAIYEYLKQYKSQLEQVWEAKYGKKKWYELRGCDYYPEFEKEKIVWGLTADKWAFAYDDKGHYLPSNGYILTSSNPSVKYLLALLNSNLMEFYFSFIGIMTAGGAFTLKHETIGEFPIREGSIKDQKPFIEFVDQILAITRAEDYLQNPQKKAQVNELERQIDQMVYELYGLTEEEIKIVEGSAGR